MVLVCIMITNPSSSTGSQCKNSISLVFADICVKVIYFRQIEAFGIVPPLLCCRLFVDDDNDEKQYKNSGQFWIVSRPVSYTHLTLPTILRV